VYHGRRDVRVQPWPDPADPGPGELQLAVSLAGICGTDLEEFRTGPRLIPSRQPHPVTGQALPLVMGHEMVGRVIAMGPGGGAARAGDRVVPGSGVWCGTCPWCRAGRTNLCTSYYTIGLHADGGLADLVNVPAKICVPVADCPDEAAVLAQPLAVAQHAVSGCAASAADLAAVVGAGGIGSLAIAVLADAGVPVVAVDVAPARLRAAARLGAVRTINASEQDAADALRSRAGGIGPDIVIECSGSAAGLRTAVRSVRRGGLVQLVGLHRDPSPLDLTRLVLDEIQIRTAKVHICGTDLPAAVAMLRRAPWIAEVLAGPAIDLACLVSDGFERMTAQQPAGRMTVRIGKDSG
jgi:(R,R)-butanediol dehydrogenase/meso-butanediol dehydrogenase/diacetyl reductase